MIIPYAEIQPETLISLIEEFVSRDGTDYGEEEMNLSDKVEQVRAKLASGEAIILFSESTGQCNIVSKDKL